VRYSYAYVVRINSVRYGILLFALLLDAETAIRGQTDPRLEQALPQIAKQASNFWHSAPSYVARETLKQKAIVPSRRKLRIGKAALEPRTPSFKDREIVSYYGFSTYHAAPEALREFRCVVTIDEKAVAEEQAARSKLLSVLGSIDDGRKRSLSDEFQKDALGGSAIDFGQLVLLFTRSKLDQYSFEVRSSGMVGAEQALTIAFVKCPGTNHCTFPKQARRCAGPWKASWWCGKPISSLFA